MIEFKKGDIFQSGCEALVNPCNTVGVMGAGLARIFKIKYPEMYKDYIKACTEKRLIPGIMHVWENPKGNPKYIINFPTKKEWGEDSLLVYITSGLLSLKKVIEDKKIKSIAIPALGSGLGNLDYKDVRHYLNLFADSLGDVSIVAYEPL